MTGLSKRKFKDFVFALVIGGSLILGVPALERATAPKPSVSVSARELLLSVFDVGQGDALLAQEGDKQILIDGGPDDTVLEKLGNVMPSGDREIDLVILTHPHADHINGLVSVLARYKVDRVLTTDVATQSSRFRRWRELIAASNIPVDDPRQVKIETVGGMEFDILNAGNEAGIRGSEHDGSTDGLNDSSIVGMLKFGARRFLLMGDATMLMEEKIMASGSDLHADLLKVAHHGSRYSTSEKFIDAVEPRYAAVSVGAKNSFGHPAWRVLQLLKDKAIATYRTDQNGTITAVTDGNSLQVSSERLK